MKRITYLPFVLSTVLSVTLAAAVSSCGKTTIKQVAGHTMVRIPDKEYYMGKTEVTQSQWKSVMGSYPSAFKGANFPVVCVSWYGCQEFLKKFNTLRKVRKSGLVFRLPTAEEWEYACRAGALDDWDSYCKLADGTIITEKTFGKVAWYDDNSDEKTHTHPVGLKEPNAFRLYDMYGNVWEWTQTTNDETRVVRGGCWGNSARDCASWAWTTPDNRDIALGFRLCAETIH